MADLTLTNPETDLNWLVVAWQPPARFDRIRDENRHESAQFVGRQRVNPGATARWYTLQERTAVTCTRVNTWTEACHG